MYDADYSRRMEARIQELRAVLKGSYTLGTVTVALDGNSWSTDHNAPYVRGICSECNAECVMAASYRGHMRQLALDIARVQCARNGHRQDYDALVSASRNYEKCAQCWHFVEISDSAGIPGIAPYVHLDNGVKEHDHDAAPSNDTRELRTWQSDHPELFVTYTDGQTGPNSALFAGQR